MELPTPLVSTDWLHEHLDQPDLLIFDTSVSLAGGKAASGKDDYLEAHIPGVQFLDLIHDLSNPDTNIPFMMPAPAQFGKMLESYGVNNDSKIVIYNNGVPMWATRLWWMIRSIGFDSVSVLDGGIKKWRAEGKAVTAEVVSKPPGKNLNVNAQPQFWADKATMIENMDSMAACTINALSPEVFSGELNQYGRPGHIPGSHNVFYGSLLNSEDGTFAEPEALRQSFKDIGALDNKPVIAYCGGGISATMDALMLYMLGKTDVAVYDGSMAEWIRDPELPLNLGEKP